jgi:hypothetical protein
VFWVVGDGGSTWGAHGRKVALPPRRAAPLGCSATTLGACFIGPYQKGPTNAETQRSYPDFFVRRNGRLSKAESAQARATDRVFSRHLLARACKAPRLYRPPLMCEPPSNPTSNLSPAALFAPTIGPAQSLLAPLSRGRSRLPVRCNGFVNYIIINFNLTFPIRCVHSREVPHGLGQAN